MIWLWFYFSCSKIEIYVIMYWYYSAVFINSCSILIITVFKHFKCWNSVYLIIFFFFIFCPQKFITSNNEHHFTVNTNFLELQTTVHENAQNNIQKIGSSTFYLPQILDSQNKRQNASVRCYISQLLSFKKNPYFWAKLPSEVRACLFFVEHNTFKGKISNQM